MKEISKPFISPNNPLNFNQDKREKFSVMYLLPFYWLAWLLIGFSLILTYTPRPIRMFFGILLGNFIFYFNKKRRNIAEKNIKLCFKALDIHEIQSLSKKYFISLGKIYFDMPSLWWKSNNSLENICAIENIHYINDALNKNKGVILLTAHTVSLDFGGRSISQFPIISMYKPFRNKLLNWFIGKSRSKVTDKSIIFPRESFPFKTLIKSLKKPIIFYYVADEDLGTSNSVFSNFFDEQKSTLVSISKLAKLSGATVIPCINHFSEKDNKYITYVSQPLRQFPSNDINLDARNINNALETLISKNLDQYMWSLRLFQSRPNGKNYPYDK